MYIYIYIYIYIYYEFAPSYTSTKFLNVVCVFQITVLFECSY